MPYKTYTTKKKAQTALSCIQFAMELYRSEDSVVNNIRDACSIANKKHGSDYIKKTALAAVINEGKEPQIMQNAKGYYVGFTPRASQRTFTDNQEKELVEKILLQMESKLCMRIADISLAAQEFRDDIPMSLMTGNKRLLDAKFERTWCRDFIARNETHFSMRKAY